MGRRGKCRNCRKFKRYCECGRPESITKLQETKLIEAFKLGMPVGKALSYARVKSSTYYEKLQRDLSFMEKVVEAQNEMTRIARKSVKKHMKRSGNLALAYLQNKESDEFNTKNTTVHDGKVRIDYDAEARARLGKYRKDAGDSTKLRGMGGGSGDDPRGKKD